MKSYVYTLILLSSVAAAQPAHLEIMIPDREDTDLKGLVKSVDTKISFNVSGDFERERKEFDRTGNLLTSAEWNAEGKFINTLTNYYDADGNFERQVYMDLEDGYTNKWDVILNPETRQIAMKSKEDDRAAVFSYSPEGYQLNYRFLNEEKKLKAASKTLRDDRNRPMEYTRFDDHKSPVYTYWFKWKDGDLIDRERQKYRQEKGERLHVYDYLKFDDHGNWTQRMMVRYDIGGREKQKVSEHLVVRDLEYFEADPSLDETPDPTPAPTPGMWRSQPDSPEEGPVSDLLKSGRSEDELREELDFTFDDIADKLVIITCTGPRGKSSGSGFIARMDGKTYIFTNQHVILGADTIRLKTPAGEALIPRGIELSVTRDVARMLIDERPAFDISTEFAVNSPVGVFGNSEGADVATALYGEVAGIGIDLVEVTADFVPGNSGSPVLNSSQGVIGIASFTLTQVIPSKEDGKKSTGTDKEDQELETKTRRLCYRLDALQWMTPNWSDYNRRQGDLYINTENTVNAVFSILSLLMKSFTEEIPEEQDLAHDLTDWVERHNNIIKRMNTGRFNNLENLYITYADSLQQLAEACRIRSRKILMFSNQKELTGFLRDEFESKSQTLANAEWYLQQIAENIRNMKDEPPNG